MNSLHPSLFLANSNISRSSTSDFNPQIETAVKYVETISFNFAAHPTNGMGNNDFITSKKLIKSTELKNYWDRKANKLINIDHFITVR